MQISETEARFKAMLSEAGFDMKKPDLLLAYNVFKSFVQEPVECEEDGILFECGTFSFTGEKQFTWELTRQFTLSVIHEGDHMEQLHCTFTCAPTDELQKLKTNLWSFDFATLHDYFAKVEELEELQIPLQLPLDWRCEISRDEI